MDIFQDDDMASTPSLVRMGSLLAELKNTLVTPPSGTTRNLIDVEKRCEDLEKTAAATDAFLSTKVPPRRRPLGVIDGNTPVKKAWKKKTPSPSPVPRREVVAVEEDEPALAAVAEDEPALAAVAEDEPVPTPEEGNEGHEQIDPGVMSNDIVDIGPTVNFSTHDDRDDKHNVLEIFFVVPSISLPADATVQSIQIKLAEWRQKYLLDIDDVIHSQQPSVCCLLANC